MTEKLKTIVKSKNSGKNLIPRFKAKKNLKLLKS